MKVAIAMTSDFICPWCLVAETRLNQVVDRLTARSGSAIEIERLWFPYELNPQMPAAGMDRQAYRRQKFGSWEYSQMLDAQTVRATQADGIEFRYDLITVTPNTLKAHRLTWFAAQYGKATQMVESILNAYFTAGENIGDIQVLANLAAGVGVNAEQASTFLQSDAGTSEINNLEQQAIAQGIRSVPTIRIGREVLSGAQSAEGFLVALQTALNEVATV